MPISITAGPSAAPQAAQTVDLDGNLSTALGDAHSWQAGPPAGRGLVTVCGHASASGAVHPLAALTVRQSAVPLEQRIERYGPDLLDEPCTYAITSVTVTVGGATTSGQQTVNVTDFSRRPSSSP